MEIKLPKLRSVDPNKPKKKKILLLSDDMRLHSGVGTVSKNLVFGTVDRYDWVQLGGAVKHPDNGKLLDISDQVKTETGVDDADVKICLSLATLFPTDQLAKFLSRHMFLTW